MKPAGQTVMLLAIVLAAATAFNGCSRKPSIPEIQEAIQVALRNNIPVSWVGNLGGGKNARITAVEVTQWGSYNKQQKYWPAKVRVIGSAQLNDPFNQNKVKQFDKVAEFRFYKDEYGAWKAELKGGMFQ